MISYESLIDEYNYNLEKSNCLEEDHVILGRRDTTTFHQLGCPVLDNRPDTRGKKSLPIHDACVGCNHSFKDGHHHQTADALNDVTVRCIDNGGPNVEYIVAGVAVHEMPVIGMYMDNRICPGFPYYVRYVGSTHDVYDGKPKILESIGMGYAHRLTFEGESLNHNTNVFWSDSQPKGFAFRLQAVNPGDVFIVYDISSIPIGEAKVESLSAPQEEIEMDIDNGIVSKTVHVWLVCTVVYFQDHYGLVDLHSPTPETIAGVAKIVKLKGDKRAKVVSISNVRLSRNEQCTLRKD